MKYEGKTIDNGVEKTIFKEKEGNFLDNIQILEKKNALFDEKVYIYMKNVKQIDSKNRKRKIRA